jgi:hypothetical protein
MMSNRSLFFRDVRSLCVSFLNFCRTGLVWPNVLRPCAGRISQTFAANQTEVQREDKDFEANAPQSPVRVAGLLEKQRLLT